MRSLRLLLLVALVLFAGARTAVAHDKALMATGDVAAFGQPVIGPVASSFVDDLTAAALHFINSLDDVQRSALMRPFSDPARYTGRDARNTPTFCAVLAWCQGWGLPQCSLTTAQEQALQALLATALSDSGYQTCRAIMNRNRVIGELENAANDEVIAAAAKRCPDEHALSVFAIPARCLPPGHDRMPDYVVTGGDVPGRNGPVVDWQWHAPGLKVRRLQFCEYAIAIFGRPGDGRWALRFEGHHLTINVTVTRDAASGAWTVHETPLFLGSFPIIVPPSPAPGDLSLATTWEAGQQLLMGPLEHARRFVLALPPEVRADARLPRDTFSQAAPLAIDTPPPWLAGSLRPTASLAIEHGGGAHAVMHASALSKAARYHLEMLFHRFFATMHPLVGEQYQRRLFKMLASDQDIVIAWSGSEPISSDRGFFLHVRVGPLLVELQGNHQWSVQHREAPVANHIHSMFRDLSFRWDYDPARIGGQHHNITEDLE